MVEKGSKARKGEVVSRKYTINLNNRPPGRIFKRKVPTAIKDIRKFAAKAMGTTDVRVDVKLSKDIWRNGIWYVPKRICVRVALIRNDEEDAKEEFYSLVTVPDVPARGPKGLETKVIEDADYDEEKKA